MEQLPKIVRDRLQATPPEPHPDPNLLAALAEDSLMAGEREQVLLHLAACADCREIVALAQPEPEMAYAAVAAMAPVAAPPARGWFSRPVFRWGTAAACAVIVGAAVLLPYRQAHKSLSPYITPPVASERQLDQMIATEKKDEVAALSQNLERDRREQDFQSANELTVKEKALAKQGRDMPMPLAHLPAAPAPARTDKTDKRVSPDVSIGAFAGERSKARAQTNKAPTSEPELNATVVGGAGGGAGMAAGAGRKGETEPVQIGQSKDSVTVSAAAPAANRSAQAVAVSPSPVPAQADSKGSLASQSPTELKSAGKVAVSTGSRFSQVAAIGVMPQWNLASDGSVLLRSVDGGKSWQTIVVANGVVLRSVAALGSDVWAGGTHGALYHSLDGGNHWLQVRPTLQGKPLTLDIIRVEFFDPSYGKLTLADGTVWTTVDAGSTWQ